MRGLRGFAIGSESEDGQAIILLALVFLAMPMIVRLPVDARPG